jgi:CheY-like chemotaxis protein
VLDVLVVEDEPKIMKLMTTIISGEGHRVITATNGDEAIRLWESERPQVILMDVQMPILDGLAATRWIRAREEETGGHVANYGLTAHVMEEDVNRCLEAGMTGHIGKPIDFREISAALAATTAGGKGLD